MFRRKAPPNDKARFTRTASKVKSINLPIRNLRGGLRL